MVRDGLSILDAARDPVIAASPALIENGKIYMFGELADVIRHVASTLASWGTGPGCRVALRATCEVSTIVTFLATLELGAALVPIHPRLTDEEVKQITEIADPTLHVSPLTLMEKRWSFVAFRYIISKPTVPLAILFTSGTTGRPKGAVLSRGAFLASAEASAKNLGWTPDDRWLVCMPLAHVGGLSIITRCVIARRPIVLEPRFDPDAVLHAIRRERVTLLSVVPTMLRALLDADHEGTLATLRLVLLGGAAAPPALLEEAAARNVLVLTTYGLTEACSQVTCQPPRPRGTTEPGSGKALPSIGLRTLEGRIQVRGPTLMNGYRTGVDREVVMPTTDDGWFDTGDLGTIDDEGRLFVHARRTDLIVTGGENVYPAEVEAALEACPGIQRAVVFGVPDERWGQIVAAGIVTQEEDPGPLIAPALARLAPHKRPRLLTRAEALPMTPTGKLDRPRAIRDLTPALKPAPKPR